MMGERLSLWRLQKFALRRVPAGEDVYLFHGVARENPNDERLFALAEVRDLTPVRDEDGRVVALPELEQMLVEGLEGIRTFQSQRPPNRRLHWNRLLLYVWPEIDLSPEEMNGLISRLAPATGGLDSSCCSSAAESASPTGRCVHACCGCSPPAAGCRCSRSTTNRPARSSHSTTVRDGSSRPAGAARCTRRRSSGC